jgi:hypothetical protein
VNNVPGSYLVKNSSQKPSGKKGRSKECISRASRIALVASLKTLHEKKTSGKKLIKEKEYNN